MLLVFYETVEQYMYQLYLQNNISPEVRARSWFLYEPYMRLVYQENLIIKRHRNLQTLATEIFKVKNELKQR